MPASPRPSTCTGTLYPGEMDRYADRLGSAAEDAAEDTDKAKIRPDDGEDEGGEE
jgi:hypothetical protein